MPYCTQEQVQAEFKDLPVSAESIITPAKIADWIAEADAEINGRVGLKYVTPVDPNSAPDAALVLRTIAIGIVAQRVKSILKSHGVAINEKQQEMDKDLAVEARKKLQLIVEGQLLLDGATLKSTGNGVSSFAVSAGLKHQFKKGVSQW